MSDEMSIQQALELALQHHQAGQLQQAQAIYEQVLANEPGCADALHLLGVLMLQTGQLQQASELIGRAIAIAPQISAYHWNLGRVHTASGQHEQAAAEYRASLALEPNHAEIWNDLGNALYLTNQRTEAIEAFRKSLAHRPDDAETHYNLANTLRDAGQLEESAAMYQQAIRFMPDFALAHSNLGEVLRDMGELDQSITSIRRAIALQSGLAEAHNNLGAVLLDRGDVNEAIATCRRAIELRPDFAESHHILGMALLQLADFEQGWIEHEWRVRMKELRPSEERWNKPRWSGQETSGQTILLHAEQGFGDTIQFVRYVPMVARLGAKVIGVCQPELKRLFSSVECVNQWFTKDEELPAYDSHCSFMSLPRIFRTTLETIPARIPYLQPDEQLSSRWRERMKGYSGAKIGMVWGSRAGHKLARRKSIPSAMLRPLGEVKGVQFFSLQKGDAAKQELPSGVSLIDWTSEFADFADTAALIENLDLVITVDTAVAHLTGALGKPVWVAEQFASDWRWMLDRTDSPWYPTMRLFRQRTAGDWSPVINEIVQGLMRYNPAP